MGTIACAYFLGIQLSHGQFDGLWEGVTPYISCLSNSWDYAVSHTTK